MGPSFHLSYTYVLKGNSGIFKIKDTSLWNFVQILDLEKFASVYHRRNAHMLST